MYRCPLKKWLLAVLLPPDHPHRQRPDHPFWPYLAIGWLLLLGGLLATALLDDPLYLFPFAVGFLMLVLNRWP